MPQLVLLCCCWVACSRAGGYKRWRRLSDYMARRTNQALKLVKCLLHTIGFLVPKRDGAVGSESCNCGLRRCKKEGGVYVFL
jgi:radical SAM superfamily enzyme